jgi:UDP-N-acetylglucosamine--N-acetylmuramyl-(pentapeptide) pyrophosphoryl-undecaprenol N-acetylglucosamine transferase
MSSPRTSPAAAPLRVALAAGGTGGHLMPALATAEALEACTPCEFLVIGSPRDNERQLRGIVPYPVVEVRVRPLAGRGLLGKLRTAAQLPGAVLHARRHLQHFAADIVIASGGYVCGATGLAAWLSGIPLLVLEQNAAPGMTTRLLRPFASAVAVSFRETVAQLGTKAVITGNPIRTALPTDRASASDRSGTHLLILGGSQGARGLNSMVELAIPQLAEADVALTVTHQTGKNDIERLREAWAAHGIPATVAPFINAMGDAYARADLVCSRAGATTCAEIAYCGLPSILVPFPAAAARHQHDNARALERVGASLIVEEVMNGTPLTEAILEVASDVDKRKRMGAAAAAAGRPDASAAVAALALSLVGRRADAATAPMNEEDDADPIGNNPANEVI